MSHRTTVVNQQTRSGFIELLVPICRVASNRLLASATSGKISHSQILPQPYYDTILHTL